jgi:hypothetical protein
MSYLHREAIYSKKSDSASEQCVCVCVCVFVSINAGGARHCACDDIHASAPHQLVSFPRRILPRRWSTQVLVCARAACVRSTVIFVWDAHKDVTNIPEF